VTDTPTGDVAPFGVARQRAGLVRIPRSLLHVSLDDLEALGVPHETRARLLALLANLPLLPTAEHSALLAGEPRLMLACLAVLARHVGQGLRDYNLSLAHDRGRLRLERRKLVFMDAAELAEVVNDGDQRPIQEAVLFVRNASGQVVSLLAEREARGLASFVTADGPLDGLAHWHSV
jgi:hypothetical protein